MKFPKFYCIKQDFNDFYLKEEEISKTICEQFAKSNFKERVRPRDRVAIIVGSRGIADLYMLITTMIECLRDLDLKPFVFSAMNSHGNVTAQGQLQILTELGVTESTTGVPVISSSEVVSLGSLDSGAEVFLPKRRLKQIILL